MNFIAIIPARFASTRFPGKPLAKIGGIPMIERVYRQVEKAIDSVVVATDDSRIFDAVENFGGRAVMTSSDHRSGTDRCFEAYSKCGANADVVINVQGDEPFIDPTQIVSLKECFEKPNTQIATLIKPFDPAGNFADLENPNSPKVVVDSQGFALYFSRSVIPYIRGVEHADWPSRASFFIHVGIYAFRSEVLRQVVALPQSSLELAESLEQLRWLQAGFKINTAITNCKTIGIDTPADLEAAEHYLSSLSI